MHTHKHSPHTLLVHTLLIIATTNVCTAAGPQGHWPKLDLIGPLSVPVRFRALHWLNNERCANIIVRLISHFQVFKTEISYDVDFSYDLTIHDLFSLCIVIWWNTSDLIKIKHCKSGVLFCVCRKHNNVEILDLAKACGFLWDKLLWFYFVLELSTASHSLHQ